MTQEKTQISNAASLPRKRGAAVGPQNGTATTNGETQDIPLELIDESDQLRLRLPPYPGVEELADKIRRFGQHTPLFVRPRGDGFELISGYRRRAALELIGAPTALCRIYRDISDSDAYDLAISENQDRGSLTDLERAEICVRLQREGKTPPQIATRMGWTGERQVYTHLRLAKDGSKAIHAALQARHIGFTVAVALVEGKVSELGEAIERDIIQTIVENNLSVRETNAHVARVRKALAGTAATAESKSTKRKRAYLREYGNGGFALTLRIDPRSSDDLESATNALETALKRVRELRKKSRSPEAASTPAASEPSTT